MNTLLNRSKIRIESARAVLLEESRAIRVLADEMRENTPLGKNFVRALHLIEQTQKKGKVIVSGMGKSAHIAKKLATTFSSTGTPSIFIHPGEASHGDLGSITKQDIVIAISNSGDSKELFDLYDYCDTFKIPFIGLTRNAKGALAKRASIPLVMPDIPEVCPIGKAPTTSTLMTMALGDALTVVAAQRVGLTKEQYKHWHPGGKLGNSLIQVSSLVRKNNHPFSLFSEKESVEKIKKALLKGPVFIKTNSKLTSLDALSFSMGASLSSSLLSVVSLLDSSPLYELHALFSNKNTIPFVVVLDRKEKPVGIVYPQDLL